MNKLPSDFTLNRYGLQVRLVDESDAEFIVRLRTTEKLGRFIHTTSSDVEAQKIWIRNYKKEEAEGKGYYFIYEVAGVPCGVNRIAKFEGKHFEGGSWVFAPDAPVGASIAADIIMREIAFDRLGCTHNLFDVRNGNTQVQKYQRRYHPDELQKTELDTHFCLSKEDFSTHKHYYLKLLNLA